MGYLLVRSGLMIYAGQAAVYTSGRQKMTGKLKYTEAGSLQ
jgi:hypothetical protein